VGTSGAPSPATIAAAKKYEMYLNALGYPVPEDVKINAAWNEKTAEAVRDAQLKLQNTALATRPGGGISIGGAPPTWYNPTPQPVFDVASGRMTAGSAVQPPSGGPPVVVSSDVPIAPSEQEKAFGTGTGASAAALGPSNPMAGPAAPGTAATANKPQPSPYGVLPPQSEERLPASPKEAETAIPLWQNRIDDWTKAIQPAQQAELRLSTIADAFQSIKTGAWATQAAGITQALAGVGIHLDPDIVNSPAKVQLVLHENILTTLPILKAATRAPTQTEFVTTTENREHPNVQPEANLQMLGEDIALMRQAQNLPAAYYASGWKNPLQFESAYLRANPLGPAVEAIKKGLNVKGTPGYVPPVPSDLPAGTTVLPPHQGSNGKPVYQLPDGSKVFR
jgi:hypothetical protein